MKIRLTQDSRDLHVYRHFGQAFDLDVPQNFDDPTIPEKIQPIGNVECTCYTTAYLAQNKTKKEYDIDELFSRVPHSSDGADPRDVFKEAIKNGLLVKGTTTYEKPFSSYRRADTGLMDAFDNVRSTMLLLQTPVAIASFWYREWLYVEDRGVLPIGKTPSSGHMYADKGWIVKDTTVADGKPVLIIEAWTGRTYLMPRETFNAAMKPYGMGAWVLSDAPADFLAKRTLIEWLIDLYKNLIITVRDMNIQDPPTPPSVEPPVVEPPKEEPKNLLTTFCESIRDYEGKPGDRNYRNNSPGNVKFYKGGYLPIYGDVKCDKDGFAIFPTYELGWLYLQNLVRSKIAAHPQRTIREFFYEYAPVSENDPETYAHYVAKQCGVTVDFIISNLIK